MNNYVSTGRIGRDIEVRYSQGGTAVGSFSLAVDRPPRKGNKQEPLWFTVKLFGDRATKLAPYLKKGKLIAVQGELDVTTWQDREGTNKTTVEINARNITLLGGGDRSQSEQTEREPGQDSEQFDTSQFD